MDAHRVALPQSKQVVRAAPFAALTSAFVLFILVQPPALAAPPPRTTGTIVRVDRGELFIDLGTDAGLEVGQTVEVFRRVEIQHPVTRKVLVDRFPIGTATISEAGRLLSIVDDFEALEPAPRVGDLIDFGRRKPELPETTASTPGPNTSPSTRPDAATSGSPTDPILGIFELTLGLPIRDRISLWEEWAMANPRSPRLPAVREEIASLSRLLAPTTPTTSPSAKPPTPTPPSGLTARYAIPTNATPDQPIELYVAVLEYERVHSLRLLVRRRGEPTYTSIPLTPDGRLGARATLDSHWRNPGVIQVRFEASTTDGAIEVLTGMTDETINVAAVERDAIDERNRSRASARFDFVSFWAESDDDQFLRFETDFRYRIGDKVLEAFRMGVGVFKGRGGSTDLLDQGLIDGEDRSINYGFAEVELNGHRLFGLAGRLLVGTYQSADRTQPLSSAFGVAVEARVGEADKTRLYGGIQATEYIGREFWLRVAIAELEGWPMEASVVVSDLPVGEDYGVSLGYGVTWQANDLFALALRVGWNARTINHSGFTAGTGVVLTW